MKKNYQLILIIIIFTLGACSTTKNIPEGKYLLDAINIKSDNKIKGGADFESYIRQQPNNSLPVLGKVGLKIYNVAGADTSKWANRFIQKIGTAPVIYNPKAAAASAEQLLQQMNNMGYLEAQVDTIQKAKKKKMSVTYSIKTGEPYRIRNYVNAVQDTTIARIMGRISSFSQLKKGDLFNMEVIEDERSNINTLLRNIGYYNFSKDFVYLEADTTLNSYEVDLYLGIYPRPDSLPHIRSKINNVTIISGFNIQDAPTGRYFRHADTTNVKGVDIIKGRRNFLRNSTLYRHNYLRKGRNYSDMLLSRTYENYNSMAAVRQTNIILKPSPEDSLRLLDAMIIISPANTHWFRTSLDGTNSAGDFGVAPSVSYQHYNLFNGGEMWNVSLKGAYEFITGKKSTDILNQNYYEYGVETGITFPMFLFPWLKKSWREQPGASTKISAGLNNQHRSEYTRQFFNGTIGYGWATQKYTLRHNLDLLDVNYVRMPSMSDKFRQEYMSDSASNHLLRASYTDQLIARTAYSITYTKKQRFTKLPNITTVRGAIEVAGALPRLVASANGVKANEEGYKKLLGIVYAEYVKGSGDYARTIPFSKAHTIAFHVNVGLAIPYGNSKVLPFERRFFGGGANSIRGWSTRSLGPGGYRTPKAAAAKSLSEMKEAKPGSGKEKETRSTGSDFVNKTGDIKLEASIESRHKLGKLFEVAAFVDAGNIWTLKDYKEQPRGQFEFDRFYQEIAVAYGLGLRFDLGFLLLRFDTGVKAYDPAEAKKNRFVLLNPRLSRMAWHFGIGYPF